MKLILSMLSALVLLSGISARAEAPVLVELFTSQGCSSCPPADAMLTELAKEKDVIALGYHVDYWDYLGWRDKFGNSDHTKRQIRYNVALRSKYRKVTPQMFVQGNMSFVGARFTGIRPAIKAHKAALTTEVLELNRDDNVLTIKATPQNESLHGLDMHLVQYSPKETVNIRAGENKGKKVVYTNVVTQLKTIYKWQRDGAVELTVRLPEDNPVVIIIQHPDGGPIVSAAVLR